MSNILIKELYPVIVNAIKKSDVEKSIVKIINDFYQYNTEALFANGPYERILFKDSDRDAILKALGITVQQVKDVIKKIPHISSSWVALNNEYNYIILLLIVYYHRKKNDEKTKFFNLYLVIYYYSMQQMRYLKYVQKETMEYTINHLSNKHDLIEHKTIIGTLSVKVDVAYETYSNDLSKDDDITLVNYLISLNTRINQWVQGITSEYMKNKESGNYFNSDTDNYDKDDYKVTTNMTEKVEGLVSSIINKFFTGNINVKIAELVSKQNDVSYISLMNTVKLIKETSTIEIVKTIVRNVLTVFLIENKKEIIDIKSQSFTNFYLLLYNNSNTKNKLIIEVKDRLHDLLEMTSDSYLKTNRLATKINWKKAVYMYICLSIQSLA